MSKKDFSIICLQLSQDPLDFVTESTCIDKLSLVLAVKEAIEEEIKRMRSHVGNKGIF